MFGARAMLEEASRRHLLAVARDAIARRLGLPCLPPALASDQALRTQRAVFVTLTLGGTLRGCVGTLRPPGTLVETVASTAVAAATADPRFPPLRVDELGQARIEISILTPPLPADGPLDIVPGTHGVIVSQGRRRGLLLPQVAVEHRWTAETFLAQTCVKAGLPPEAWRAGARIEVFTAEVFSES